LSSVAAPDGLTTVDLRLDLQSALADLHELDRAILILRFWMGLSVAETAVQVRLSETAVRARSSRAAKRVRQRMVASGDTEECEQ
jgi:RNA polymerase sigma factor (sigma-70 family)